MLTDIWFVHLDVDTFQFCQALKETEANILGASTELKVIVKETGDTAESLFDRVNDGYTELTVN